MKFIILVSNLKEIYKNNYDAILSKYDSAEKRYINYANYAYVLKNGVVRFNIFFFIPQEILIIQQDASAV
jgi:hypothetical protein